MTDWPKNAKEELLDHIQMVTGGLPSNARYILKVLAHPDLIEHTRRYFSEMDDEARCQNYEAPWSCAREAEALYKNIKYGWLGGASGIGFDESWCEPCRRKVLDE
jgi:hypothetical protein